MGKEEAGEAGREVLGQVSPGGAGLFLSSRHWGAPEGYKGSMDRFLPRNHSLASGQEKTEVQESGRRLQKGPGDRC